MGEVASEALIEGLADWLYRTQDDRARGQHVPHGGAGNAA